MRIVVDRNIPYAQEAFRLLGEVRPVETGEVTAGLVHDADALVIRSETRVGASLLEGSRVTFVGTATIGTDHIDRAYLASRGIVCANAPGSNANSVAEYVVAALLTISRHSGRPLKGKTLGIVGVGNVGSRVARKAEALGMRLLLNDPPLSRATGEAHYVPLEALMQADFVTLHVPLTREGPDPTFRLFDLSRMEAMKRGSVLLNTSRGPVVEGRALSRLLDRGHLSAAVLDVWEDEPAIDVALLGRVALGTAHISGYSLDGKVNAVGMVYGSLCHHLGVERAWMSGPLPPPSTVRIDVTEHGDEEQTIHEIVKRCYDIEHDDAQLRPIAHLPVDQRGAFFRRIRKENPVRREFAATTVCFKSGNAPLAPILRDLGFNVTQ